jgi:hypothetical protein
LFLRTYAYVVYSFFSGKSASMFRASPTQFYERRKNSRCDVDTDEGGSSNPPPQRQSKRTVHRDFPQGRMHIDTTMEEGEVDCMETSDDESADDETYQMSPMLASENIVEEKDEGDGSEKIQEEAAEEEERMVEGTLNPRTHKRNPFTPSPTICIPHKSLHLVVKSYNGKGATKHVKKLRKIDPRSQQRDASDYRFHTSFQQNLYEIVIMDRRRIVSEAQWIDWEHMEAQQDPIYDQVIAACESHHLKILMGIHYDWNVEVIAYFYATLYIEERGGARRMHWMIEGDWYNISFDNFASRFSFGAADTHRVRLHIHNPLGGEEMKFMYAP